MEPVYQKRKIVQLKQQRLSITQNNSPKNALKNMNNLKPEYAGKNFNQKKNLLSSSANKSTNELFKRKSERKKNNSKNRIGVNYSPNQNLIIGINDRNESLNASNSGNYDDDSHSLTENKNEYKNIKKYIVENIKKEIKKLKYREEDEINLVKEEYNKLI